MSLRRTPIALITGLGVILAASLTQASSDSSRESVTVSFGAGLNTAQPGNAANHHILPQVIRIKPGGVVNFVVAGFHQIFVYKPGTTVDDVQAAVDALPAPPPLFINFTDNLYYQGLSPVVAPPAGLSNAMNRVESVSFAQKGTYLVICNVRPHFLDGMTALVKVGDDDDGEDAEDAEHHHGQ
jgi:plastocyanin